MNSRLPFKHHSSFGRVLAAALLAILLPTRGGEASLCVRLKSDTNGEVSLPVKVSSSMRLGFRHSIYGSQVDEVFSLRPDGFELTQLRYSEARLAEFYGYEHARNEDGVWIVTPAPLLLSSLNLNLSHDAVMSLSFDQSPGGKRLAIQPGGALRLTVATCENGADD